MTFNERISNYFDEVGSEISIRNIVILHFLNNIAMEIIVREMEHRNLTMEDDNAFNNIKIALENAADTFIATTDAAAVVPNLDASLTTIIRDMNLNASSS